MSRKPGGVAGSYIDGFSAKSDEVAAEGAKLQPKEAFRGAHMSKITITIDGRQFEVTEGERLLDVLNRNDIWVPTLCDHPDLKPYGACRLCIVELDGGNWSKTVTACNFPVKDGQTFKTSSEKIISERNMIMEFTLARSSKTPEVVELAKRLGVESVRFPSMDEGCILCGLCIRVCNEVVEANAISFAERGPKRRVSSPLDLEAKDCIGCGACAYICPTKYIKMTEDEDTRTIPLWNVSFDFARCKKCNQKIAPKKQIEFIQKKAKDMPKDWFEICQNCR